MIGLVKTILTKTALSFKVENIDVFFKMKVGKSYIIREPLIFFDNVVFLPTLIYILNEKAVVCYTWTNAFNFFLHFILAFILHSIKKNHTFVQTYRP